jgi:two-component system, OmpR family, sensor histidine kinase KdpD
MIDRLDWRRLLAAVAVSAGALAGTTLLIAALESTLGVPNASAAYLLAVVAVAMTFGTITSAATALAAFLLYDYLFTQPVHTFAVANPGEWLNLLLLLVVGFVVGQLVATLRGRAQDAELREREARALFAVSRALATRERTSVGLETIVATLVREARMSRIWVALGEDPSTERAVADTRAGGPPARPTAYSRLVRTPGATPARWIRVHDAGAARGRRRRELGEHAYRVNIEAAGHTLGALWGLRPLQAGMPTREESRMLGASADQIGQAIEQDRLRAEATSAELARRSDALKGALLDSVSHDLRTPLASIRAAAGALMDPAVRWRADERRITAEVIDREAERLNRLVTNLLDLSRIEAGGLRADLETYPLQDLVETTLRRVRSQLDGRPIEVEIDDALPLAEVDATFMDQIITNLLENAMKYVPVTATIRVRGESEANGAFVRLVVEDGGPGVPGAAIPRLFEKFYRVPGRGGGARPGTGIGLAVVRGLAEVMGGRVEAAASPLGGLAVTVSLPVARATTATSGPTSTAVAEPAAARP